MCYDKIIVELKAAMFIHPDSINQTRNYLKTTKFELGLLVNFGEKVWQISTFLIPVISLYYPLLSIITHYYPLLAVITHNFLTL